MAYGGNWIDQIEDNKPFGTESKSLGDDAIKEIKRCLTNTFPVAATDDPLTVTMSEINTVVNAGLQVQNVSVTAEQINEAVIQILGL